jgi:hypothetical protein
MAIMIATTQSQSGRTSHPLGQYIKDSERFSTPGFELAGRPASGWLKATYESVRQKWSKTVSAVNQWLDAA